MIDLYTFEEEDRMSWRAVVSGMVVYRGKFPHFGAARALIDAGTDPDEDVTSYAPNGTPVFRSKVGALAYWKVDENTTSIKRWKPHFKSKPLRKSSSSPASATSAESDERTASATRR